MIDVFTDVRVADDFKSCIFGIAMSVYIFVTLDVSDLKKKIMPARWESNALKILPLVCYSGFQTQPRIRVVISMLPS